VGGLNGKPGLVDRVNKLERTHKGIVRLGWLVLASFTAQFGWWIRSKFGG